MQAARLLPLLLLFFFGLSPLHAEEKSPHAAFDRIPSYLGRVAVGDRATYQVVLEQAGAPAERVTLEIEVDAVTEQRCTLLIRRRTAPGESPVTSMNHLPRRARWRTLWQEMMRQKGIAVKLVSSAVSPATLQLGARRVDCRKVTLSYRGTCHVRGRSIALEARTTYWLSPELPLQGIAKSISRFTLLDRGGKKTAYRVTLTIENPGRTAK